MSIVHYKNVKRPLRCPVCGEEISGAGGNCPRCGAVFAPLGPEERPERGQGGGQGPGPAELLPLLVALLAAAAWLLLR